MNRLLSVLLSATLLTLLIASNKEGIPIYIPWGIFVAFILHGLIKKEN